MGNCSDEVNKVLNGGGNPVAACQIESSVGAWSERRWENRRNWNLPCFQDCLIQSPTSIQNLLLMLIALHVPALKLRLTFSSRFSNLFEFLFPFSEQFEADVKIVESRFRRNILGSIMAAEIFGQSRLYRTIMTKDKSLLKLAEGDRW